MTRALLLAALAALAAAAPAGADAARFAPPMELPSRAAAASHVGWIVGARPTARAARVARRHGAEVVAPGTYGVRRGAARRLARALGRDLVWAEPDHPRRSAQAAGGDPIATPWRDQVVAAGLAPPAVTPQSPLLALIDSPLDRRHPEFAGGNTGALDGEELNDLHGTATAAIAAAPRNGVGIVGVWPGMRAVNVPLPPQPFTCADSARGIRRAIEAGATVINMSFGSTAFCFAEYVQLQGATARGITPVAAAGNEFANGNPLLFPGGMPHVLTIAAVDPQLDSSYFSSANAAIDLSAPGEGVVAAVPAQYDEDPRRDGYMALDGTSFAAPMAAAAVAWIRQERPTLTPDQAAQVVRLSARDLGEPGWEPHTGFGLLDIAAALRKEPPPRDPGEPNDDVVWVDGRAFGKPDRSISTGGRPADVSALLDRLEDPADVYRVQVPARRALRISARSRFGDADLAVYDRDATALSDRDEIVASSTRGPGRTDAATIRNRSGRTRTAYVVLVVKRGSRSLDAGYRLSVRRSRAR